MANIKRLLLNGHAVALWATLTLSILLYFLQPVFRGAPPLDLLLVGVMLATWRGGFRAGFLATALSALAGVYLLTEPLLSWQIAEERERLRLLMFVGVGGLTSLIIARLRQGEQRVLRETARQKERLEEEIAMRKQAEEAWRTSEERLLLALRIGRAGVWSLDVASDSALVSDSYSDLYGFPAGQPVSLDDWLAAVHPEDRERCLAHNEEMLRTGEESRTEFRIIHPERGERWIDAIGRAELDARGRPARVSGINFDITERKRGEEALREKEHFLERVIQVMPGILHVFDLRERRAICINRPVATVLGFSPEEADAMGAEMVPRLMHPEDLPRLERHMARVGALDNGEIADLEFQMRDRAGEWHWFQSHDAVFARDATGAARQIIGVATEITGRKRAEENLKKIQAQLRIFIQQAVVSAAMFDRDMNYVVASGRWLADHGLAADTDLVGRNHYEVSPDLPDRWKDIHRQGLAGAALNNDEDLWIQASGNRFWLRWAVAPWIDSDGGIGGIVISAENITGRKLAEEALREKEHFLQRVTQIVPGILHVFDLVEKRAVFINRAVASMLGFTPEEVQAMGNEVLPRLMHPEDLPRFEQHMAHVDALADGEVADFEFRMRGRAGEWHWFHSYDAVFARDDAGAVRQLIGMATEITGRKQIEEELRESESRLRRFYESGLIGVFYWTTAGRITDANDKFLEMIGYDREELTAGRIDWKRMTPPEFRHLDERALAELRATGVNARPFEKEYIRKDGTRLPIIVAGAMLDEARNNGVAFVLDNAARKQFEAALLKADRQKDEFLAMLAHELRNPLAPVVNAAQILGRPGLKNAQFAWCRDVIDRQAAHLTRLVDDLLDVSRISQGKIELRKEPINVADLVQRAIETNRPLIDGRRHELTVLLPPEPILIEGDMVRLAQVVSNLLNNAAKYTDMGGRIGLSVGCDGAEVAIRVRDTGHGIDSESLSHVFDLFYQTNRTLDRSEGGLGIGLSLVKRLVDLHGGTVQAFSAGRGRGSEFVVRLPRLPDPPAIEPVAATMAPASGFNILVVDDNHDAADSLALLLESDGHRVRTAYDGETGLKMALAEPPRVVLLDLGLPGMDGYAVARALRGSAEMKGSWLVALTGYGQAEDREKTRASGFDRHLVKPVDFNALRGALADYRVRGG